MHSTEVSVSEADLIELLGRSVLGGNRSCAQQRMNYKEVTALRTNLEAQVVPYIREVVHPSSFEGREPVCGRVVVLPKDLSDSVRERIAHGVKRIASGSMSGRELSGFSVVTGFLDSDWYEGGDEIPEIQGGMLFAPTMRAAKCLAHAIGTLEGNLPLDARGYGPDAYASDEDRYEIVKADLQEARKATQPTLRLGPDTVGASVFGDIPTTVYTINAIVDRAEVHHPTLGGVAIGDPFQGIAVADYVLRAI